MSRALALAAIAEIITGAALLLAPALVGQLLLGENLAGIAVPVARILGIALLGLGIACWPGPPIAGMLVYGAGVAVYLAWLGFRGEATGVLLWPVVVLHVVVAALLLRVLVADWRR